jgi:hypothetical protein
MTQPVLQTQTELDAIDDDRFTGIAILNPSVALLEAGCHLSVLISRDTILGRKTIHLRGARLVRIPLGWRLALLRLRSRVGWATLPEEYEFREVEVDKSTPSAIARADGYFLCNVVDPSLVLPITAAEYLMLMSLSGRRLHQWVSDHFGTGVGIRALLPRIVSRRSAA